MKMSTGYNKLGEILVEKGYVSQENITKALTLQVASSTRLGEIVTSMGWANEEQVTQCLAEQYDYKIVDPKQLNCEPSALKLLNNQRALRDLILPVGVEDGFLKCVVGDPINVVPIDALRSAQQLPLSISMAEPSKLREVIIQQYFKGCETKSRKASVRTQKIDNQTDKAALLKALEFELNHHNQRSA